jgi:hypothetical protein
MAELPTQMESYRSQPASAITTRAWPEQSDAKAVMTCTITMAELL